MDDVKKQLRATFIKEINASMDALRRDLLQDFDNALERIAASVSDAAPPVSGSKNAKNRPFPFNGRHLHRHMKKRKKSRPCRPFPLNVFSTATCKWPPTRIRCDLCGRVAKCDRLLIMRGHSSCNLGTKCGVLVVEWANFWNAAKRFREECKDDDDDCYFDYTGAFRTLDGCVKNILVAHQEKGKFWRK